MSLVTQVLFILIITQRSTGFLWGDKHFKHVPLLTYQIYFLPKGYIVYLFTCLSLLTEILTSSSQTINQPLTGFEPAFVLMFLTNKFLNFLRKMFNTQTIKVNNFIIFYIQSNPMCACICIFIKVYYICSIFYCF